MGEVYAKAVDQFAALMVGRKHESSPKRELFLDRTYRSFPLNFLLSVTFWKKMRLKGKEKGEKI